MTILTPERLAEIEARLAFDDERGVTHPHAETLRRLLASHAALAAEVERLREDAIAALEWARSDAIKLFEATEEIDATTDFERGRVYEAKHCRNAIGEAWRDEIQKIRDESWSTDLSTKPVATAGAAADLTTARESAAREMREALAAIVNSPTINSVCGWYSEIEVARKLLSALPLTPADGAKDENV